MKRLYLKGTELVLDTPYNKDEVKAFKTSFPTARWDKIDKHWTIPLSNLKRAVSFANSWGIDVDEDIIRLQLPDHPVGETTIRLEKAILQITVPYETLQIHDLKAIPGIKWNAHHNHWETPYTNVHDLIQWADKYNHPIPDHIRTQADIETQKAQHAQNLTTATDANINIPTLQLDLYPYQKAGVQYATEKQRTFIADEMGCGKSLQAIATTEHTNQYPALIICPTSLTEDWKNKIQEALPNRTIQTIEGRKNPQHDRNRLHHHRLPKHPRTKTTPQQPKPQHPHPRRIPLLQKPRRPTHKSSQTNRQKHPNNRQHPPPHRHPNHQHASRIRTTTRNPRPNRQIRRPLELLQTILRRIPRQLGPLANPRINQQQRTPQQTPNHLLHPTRKRTSPHRPTTHHIQHNPHHNGQKTPHHVQPRPQRPPRMVHTTTRTTRPTTRHQPNSRPNPSTLRNTKLRKPHPTHRTQKNRSPIQNPPRPRMDPKRKRTKPKNSHRRPPPPHSTNHSKRTQRPNDHRRPTTKRHRKSKTRIP